MKVPFRKEKNGWGVFFSFLFSKHFGNRGRGTMKGEVTIFTLHMVGRIVSCHDSTKEGKDMERRGPGRCMYSIVSLLL